MIKPWLFEFFHELRDPAERADPANITAHFRFHEDLWVDCERLGFEGIFFSEHHFGGAYSPSPNLLMPRVAARTKTLRLGALGSVSAYATPWRLVEEMGMLDHLLDGRLEMGVVRGIPPEQHVVGIDEATAAERHDEALAVIGHALRGAAGTDPDSGPDTRTVTHHGKHYHFTNLRIVPRPAQQPHPPLWTAVRTKASSERAAELGYKVCAGFNSTEDIAGWFDGYRAVAAANGQPHGPEQLAIRRKVTIVDREDQQAEGRLLGQRSLKELLEHSAGGIPPFAAILDQPDITDSPLSPQEFIAGTPRQVAEEIIAQCQAVGAGHFLASFSEIDHHGLRRAHRLFGEEVIPRLRAASV